jgi:hypothetical protein
MPLGYSEARGSEALRGALAETYRDVSPEAILVTTGAIEANFLLYSTLLRSASISSSSVGSALGCSPTPWINRRAGFGRACRFSSASAKRVLQSRAVRHFSCFRQFVFPVPPGSHERSVPTEKKLIAPLCREFYS